MMAHKTENRISLAVIFLLVCLNANYVLSQSNYASHGNNINYIGDGLPEETILDGKVTKLDDLNDKIFLNRTNAALNCAAGSMQVDMKFKEPFYGIAYADFDRNSACQIIGKGHFSYNIEIPLKGCGTRQDPQRVFTNNIVVRFHPGLEMDGDEIITIVCRYPPPVVPQPAGLPEKIQTGDIGAVPPLKGIQILFIICALMFLTLLLLGLAVSYYCLRTRAIPVITRVPMSVGSGSEITKLSGSSLGNLSAFEGLKIPRAHPPLHQSSSGSDGPLISDTLPSDYPSESQSEIEEVDARSLPVSSTGSYENRAYLQEAASVYSENLGQIQEIHAVAVKAPSPQFDVQVRVKRAPPPPPSPPSTSSESESIATSRIERNNLSTIMESHEDRESILTIESLPHDVAHSQFTYTPELHPAPKYIPPPTASSKLNKNLEEYKKIWPEALPTRSEAHSMTEIVDTTHLYQTSVDIDVADNIEPPIQISRKPEVSTHIVDDVFLRTITEKRTIEDIERERRMVTEYKARPAPPDPKWDVRIRNYDQTGPQWEDFSDISSASGMTIPKVEKPPMAIPPMNYISETGEHLRSPEMVGNMKPIELPEEDKSVPNWDVLIRVLEDFDETTHDHRYETSTNILKRQLSYEDRIKWKEIITTESTLRKMLTEAVVREDFEKISRDVRYEGLFEPQSWDVIIRILAPPDDVELRQPRKSKDKRPAWDTRSRRSSLPTLYEYDSDGGSSVRTIRNESLIVSTQQPGPSHHYIPRSRKTSRSSYRSDHVDMRSMTEVTVDFARQESIDTRSDASSYHPRYYDDDHSSEHRSLQRSLSHPSLARSASEFTEHWIAPEEMSSPEGSPRMRRNQRVLTTFQPRPFNATSSASTASEHRVVETQYVEQRTMQYQSDGKWYKQNE
jgi:hypothetical protein